MKTISMSDFQRVLGYESDMYASWLDDNQNTWVELNLQDFNGQFLLDFKRVSGLPNLKVKGQAQQTADFSNLNILGDLHFLNECRLVRGVSLDGTRVRGDLVVEANFPSVKEIKIEVLSVEKNLRIAPQQSRFPIKMSVSEVGGDIHVLLPGKGEVGKLVVGKCRNLKISSSEAGAVLIENSRVEGRLDFRNLKANGKISLVSSVFCMRADISEATFLGDFVVTNCEFCEGLSCVNSNFGGICDFISCEFFRSLGNPTHTSFQFTRFERGAAFYDCNFDSPPDFRGITLESGSTIDGLSIQLRPPSRNIVSALAHVFPADYIERTRKLKDLANSANDHEKEIEYFAMELRAKRGNQTDRFGSFVNLIYEVLSGYGYCASRPLVGLATTFFAFSFVYAAIADDLDWSYAFSLSLANVFIFVPHTRDIRIEALASLYTETPALVHWLAVAEGLAGAVLVFLFGLTLRNRFRM